MTKEQAKKQLLGQIKYVMEMESKNSNTKEALNNLAHATMAYIDESFALVPLNDDGKSFESENNIEGHLHEEVLG